MKGWMRRIWQSLWGCHDICFASCPSSHGAWCRRREGHHGRHKASSGLTWNRTNANADDLHVMPNDGTHVASVECWCGPRVDDGVSKRGKVWVHHAANPYGGMSK